MIDITGCGAAWLARLTGGSERQTPEQAKVRPGPEIVPKSRFPVARTGELRTVSAMTDNQAPPEGQTAPLMARPKIAASLFDVSAAHLARLERRDPELPRPYRSGRVVLQTCR